MEDTARVEKNRIQRSRFGFYRDYRVIFRFLIIATSQSPKCWESVVIRKCRKRPSSIGDSIPVRSATTGPIQRADAARTKNSGAWRGFRDKVPHQTPPAMPIRSSLTSNASAPLLRSRKIAGLIDKRAKAFDSSIMGREVSI